MEAGECFLRPGGGHLWIVISDPKLDHRCVVAVNISTVKETTKANLLTCVLNPGDHPFVNRRSYVVFKLAMMRTNAQLEKMVGGGGYEIQTPVTPEVLEKIREAALASDDIPMDMAQILQSQLLD
ncbi:hypothetical protein [Rhodopirellula baltica]|nr:hypothetical protein [Rhodopirellula baltica]